MTERDPHLLAALRHAPDRDALPPRELSARILAAARDAVRPPSSRTSRPGLWAWLLQPQVGAAFATLAVAVLVGLMWSAQEPSVPVPSVAEPPQPASPSADAVKEAPSQGAELSKSNAAPPPPPVTAKSKPAAPPVAPAKAPVGATRSDQAAATSPRMSGGLAEGRGAAARDQSAAAPPAAQPAPSPFPPSAAPPRVAAAPAAAVPAPATADATTPPGMRRESETDSLRARQERPARGSLAAPESVPADPTAALDALLDSAPQDVIWRAGGRSHAHGAAQRAWWAALRAATAGRWQPDAGLRVAQLPAWINLSVGARTTATLAIDGEALLLTEGGRSWRAQVGAAALRAWQDELSRW